MIGRESFAYVVSIDGPVVTLNLKDAHRGHFASHRDGISAVTEINGLFGVDGGTRLIVMRVRSLSFAEAREAHSAGVGSASISRDPLRNVVAVVAGIIERHGGTMRFLSDSLVSPSLGAEAYPLSSEENSCVLNARTESEPPVCLGNDTRGGGSLTVGLSSLLGRHVAVLGSTGQGKSCFTASILQQLLKLDSPRIVIFDINGEYGDALRTHASKESDLLYTVLGGPDGFKIPYFALGRHGLSRLLLPSEKTQRPALAFALENIQYLKWFSEENAAGLMNSSVPVFFDDCRPGDAKQASDAIDKLRSGSAEAAKMWPPMGALGCLVAESHSIKKNLRQGSVYYERDSFAYSNVSALITRIHRCIEDPLFTSVVDVGPHAPCGSSLDWHAEGSKLVEDVFGGSGTTWKVHVIDLRNVAHDLTPLVLGSLLELYAFELFRRGQSNSYPTLLVLEEAHHYLRQYSDQEDGGRQSLAYERLAKEGRKFGLGIWISTQRPAEVSSTVLSQCGTWVVFRLTSESDLRAVASAGEWVDKQELLRIAGLPRRQALVFGSSVAIPVRVEAPLACPLPRSADPDFAKWAQATTTPQESPAKR